MAVVTDEGDGGVMARRLLPTAIPIPRADRLALIKRSVAEMGEHIGAE